MQTLQRKSLQGLDNTAADGAAGFQTIETLLVETLEKGGMEKQWCLRICQNLLDAKRYLKTDYRVHCQQHYSTCADHCRKFALSDPVISRPPASLSASASIDLRAMPRAEGCSKGSENSD